MQVDVDSLNVKIKTVDGKEHKFVVAKMDKPEELKKQIKEQGCRVLLHLAADVITDVEITE